MVLAITTPAGQWQGPQVLEHQSGIQCAETPMHLNRMSADLTWKRGEQIVEAWNLIEDYLSRSDLESIHNRLSEHTFRGDGGPFLIADLALSTLVKRQGMSTALRCIGGGE